MPTSPASFTSENFATNARRLLQPVALAAVPLAALGLGRFAYGLILPVMQDAHGWSYTASGLVAAAYAVGYLGGAATAARVASKLGPRRAVVAFSLLAALSLAAMAVSGDVMWSSCMRFVNGYAGAVAFVSGGVIAAGFQSAGARHAIAVYPAGAGAGVILSAIALGPISPADWRTAWVILGAGAILASAVAVLALQTSTAPAGPAAPRVDVGRLGSGSGLPAWTSTGYALFGLGYVTAATFAVAFLADQGANAESRRAFWLVVGSSAVLGAAVWPAIMARLGGGLPLAVPTFTVAASVTVLLVGGVATAPIAGVLFGASFLNAITGVTTLVHRHVEPPSWPTAIGVLTCWSAVGQAAGPLLSGLVGDSAAGLRIALWGSVGVLLVAALLAASSSSKRTGELDVRHSVTVN